MLFLIMSAIFLIALLTASGSLDGAAQFAREQAKGTGPEAKAKAPSAQPSIGEGCKSSLMTLVENSGAVAKGCLIARNQWRFWCLDGSIYDDLHSCAKSAPTIQAAEGE